MQVDGTRIRRLREDKGMTGRDLAACASLSTSHLSLIESGLRGVSPHVAARLAAALDVSIVDLRRNP